MSRISDARPNAIRTTERLVRLKGAAATGVAEIISESGAPKGSFYFHFPGGKEQLLIEMLDGYSASALLAIGWAQQQADGNAARFVSSLCQLFADQMEREDFRLGCALQALSDEYAGTGGKIDAAVQAHMASWIDALTQVFEACGKDQELARTDAFALLAALQGARTIAKAIGGRTAFAAIESSLVLALTEADNPSAYGRRL